MAAIAFAIWLWIETQIDRHQALERMRRLLDAEQVAARRSTVQSSNTSTGIEAPIVPPAQNEHDSRIQHQQFLPMAGMGIEAPTGAPPARTSTSPGFSLPVKSAPTYPHLSTTEIEYSQQPFHPQRMEDYVREALIRDFAAHLYPKNYSIAFPSKSEQAKK